MLERWSQPKKRSLTGILIQLQFEVLSLLLRFLVIAHKELIRLHMHELQGLVELQGNPVHLLRRFNVDLILDDHLLFQGLGVLGE